MKLTHLSTVSALALVLALGTPATAQVTAEPPVDEPTVGTTQPTDDPTVGTTQPTDDSTVGETVTQDFERDRLSVSELDEMMGQIGIEDAELFAGQVVTARTGDGDPVIMLIGPQDFEHGEVASLDIEQFGDLQEQLTAAGFDHVRQEHAWQVFQGTLNGHHVFAASGDPTWGVDVAERDIGVTRPSDDVAERAIGEPDVDMATPDYGTTERGVGTAEPGVDMAEPGVDMAEPGVGMAEPGAGTTEPGVGMAEPGTGTTEPGVGMAEPGIDTTEPRADLAEPELDPARQALARDFDRDRFEATFDEVGIEDRSEFQGKLVRARTEDGQSIQLLIGREGFAGEEEIELTEDELREKLEEAGLTGVRVVEDNIAMIRGSYSDHSVLILGGQGIATDPMRTGAARTGQGFDVTDTDQTE